MINISSTTYMKKFNWKVATAFLLTTSSIATLVTIPTIITLTNKKQEIKLTSQEQASKAKIDQTFQPEKIIKLLGYKVKQSIWITKFQKILIHI